MKKFLMYVVLLFTVTLLAIPVMAQVNPDTKNEIKLKTDLKKVKNKELVGKINSNSKDIHNEELILIVGELFERKNDFSNSDIVSEVKDNSNSILTQEIMVDLYTIKNEGKLDKNEMKQLLKDKTVDKKVKSRIVANSKFDNTDSKLLEELIADDEGILAFNSLKKLSRVDAKKAYLISKEILSNFESESNFKISASQKSIAKYLKNSNDNSAKKAFIQKAMEIIKNSNSDPMLKDSSVFALSDMMSKEAIVNIIKSDSVDRELKAFSIEQNYHTLKEILENSACSENDIEIVVEAMEILPIVDLYDNLENVQNTIKEQELKNRCSVVLSNMKVNGIKATKKWLD